MAALAFGVAAMVAGVGVAYRYTISPKAADRMAEANRRYVPPKEKNLTPRQAAALYGSLFVVELGVALFLESVTLAVVAAGTAAFHAIAYRRASEQHR